MTHILDHSMLDALLFTLPRVGNTVGERSFDASLHRFITGRTVIAVTVTIPEILEARLPGDAAELYRVVEGMKRKSDEDWAEENHVFEPEGLAVPHGYEDINGVFVARPELRLVPRYTSDADDAISFKRVLLGNLTATVDEVADPDGTAYVARLLDAGAGSVSAFQSDRMALSLVGASLLAARRGWLNPTLGWPS